MKYLLLTGPHKLKFENKDIPRVKDNEGYHA